MFLNLPMHFLRKECRCRKKCYVGACFVKSIEQARRDLMEDLLVVGGYRPLHVLRPECQAGFRSHLSCYKHGFELRRRHDAGVDNLPPL